MRLFRPARRSPAPTAFPRELPSHSRHHRVAMRAFEVGSTQLSHCRGPQICGIHSQRDWRRALRLNYMARSCRQG